jgi:type II secretory pathway pseudopilin PulG
VDFRLLRRGPETVMASGRTATISLLLVLGAVVGLAVVGTLGAVASSSLAGLPGRGAQSACNSDAESVETAAAAYQVENSTPLGAINGTGTASHGPNPLVPRYLRSWPTENSSEYTISITSDPAGRWEVMVTPMFGRISRPAQSYDAQSAAVASAGKTSVAASGCYAVR